MNFVEIVNQIWEYKQHPVRFVSLKEFGTFYRGLSGKTKYDFINGNAKYIPYKNVFQNMFIDPNYVEYVKVDDSETNHKFIQYGDVLFTGSSENKEETGLTSVVDFHPTEKIYVNSFCLIYRPHDLSEINPRYLGYLFRSNKVREQIVKFCNGVTRYNLSTKAMDFKFPLPSLEIQNKIVSLLDVFTALLTALRHEEKKRKDQYIQYREDVLSFSDRFLDILYSGNEIIDIKNVKVSELGWTKKGRKLNLYQHELNDSKGYPVYSSKTYNEGILGYLPTYDYDMEAITWNIVGEAGTMFYRNGKFTINDNCGLLTITSKEVLPKYLYYVLSIKSKKCVNYNSTLPMMNCNSVDNIEVSLPSLSAQSKIVDFLDSLSSYLLDIRIGLPAEIKLRQQQYQYYWNQLLDFKEQ